MKIFCATKLFVATVILAVGVTANADVVTDWNDSALNTIRALRTAPPVASRALAILHVSMFDAVNGIDRKYHHYYVPSSVSSKANKVAAASAAAHKVLVTLFPTNAASFDDLHHMTLAAIPDNHKKVAGMDWGMYVADAILALRANDGASAVVAPPNTTGAGAWQPTPPAYLPYALPQWAFVTPFAMLSPDHFRAPGPPALDSAEYAAEYNEVKVYGVAVGSLRTADQDEIALFWADGAGTETPPGHWNSIAKDVGAQMGNSLAQNARMFALLNVAMADAAISAWDSKYTFNFWRPVTAIVNGDIDGNDATEMDAAWTSFIITPPFPDYTSGHSTFSGAASMVLAKFYKTDAIAFTTGSDFLPGVTRSFPGFSAAAAEAAASRLYGGIHYASANNHGITAGNGIGEYTFMNYMQRKK